VTPQLPPLSLYVHMPWCVRKCPYCDFNSHAAPASVPQTEYIDALLADLASDLHVVQGRALGSIFFGGGTPSLFTPEEVGRFLSGVRERMPLADGTEITLEANPGTIERGRFAGYRDAGINRVSLGAQTFDERQLKVLGRIHDRDDIHAAVAELREAGLDHFNIDLMYALPEQTLEQALHDIDVAVSLRPAHVSHYQLTLEPGTAFYHRPPPLPDPDLSWQMQIDCQAQLAAAGYEQYEVSAYALPGRRSRHNLNYWRFGDYLGIGAGAHGKVTKPAETGVEVVRTTRIRMPREYLRSVPALVERRVVAVDDLPFEFMLNALRLLEGFTEREFETRTGRPFAAIASIAQNAAQKGLLERDREGRWAPTGLGQRFLNDLQEMFLPDALPSGSPSAASSRVAQPAL
jgi:putative oxygen-independent coproporphyrinogen III oxidase